MPLSNSTITLIFVKLYSCPNLQGIRIMVRIMVAGEVVLNVYSAPSLQLRCSTETYTGTERYAGANPCGRRNIQYEYRIGLF